MSIRHPRMHGTTGMAMRTLRCIVAAGTFISGTLHACNVVLGSDLISGGEIKIADETRPDVLLHTVSNGRGGGLLFTNCPRVTDIDIQSVPQMAGLTYVRDITFNGRPYPAFGWGPDSPLIVFNFVKYSAGAPAGTDNTPYRADATNTFQVKSGHGGDVNMTLGLGYYIYSRGGAMTNVAPTTLSAITTMPGFPANGSLQHSLSLSLVIPARTCALFDTALQLSPASADQFPTVGASTGDTPLNVLMNCPRDGIKVNLTLHDALDAGNKGSILTPTPSHSGTGIAVQLLRNGQPVHFGNQWTHAGPHAGDQNIELTARYVRIAGALTPGSVQGKAILTADYD